LEFTARHKDLQIHGALPTSEVTSLPLEKTNFIFVSCTFLDMAESNTDLTSFQHTINKSIDDLDPVLREINKKVSLTPHPSPSQN
jgi:hypothetical protein